MGPAGAPLDEALANAAIDRSACYLTNAVKQFKYVARGKKRIHQRPTTGEIVHYRWWLARGLTSSLPESSSRWGPRPYSRWPVGRLSVTEHRGPFPLLAQPGFVTVHPSAILRIPERTARHAALRAFEADLKKIRRLSLKD